MSLAAAALGAISASALVLAVFYPALVRSTRAEERKREFVEQTQAALFGDERAASKARRQIINERLQKLNEDEAARLNGRDRTEQLQLKLDRSGLGWSIKTYRRIQIGVGAVAAVFVLIGTGSLWLALPIAAPAALLLPKAVMARSTERRYAKFADELPNALDVMVRGTRAGLPVAECIRTVAREAAEPLKAEFELLVQAQNFGATLTEATEMLSTRVPIADTRFFALAVSIQETEGGAIADTLNNLSSTLRERRKIFEKVRAMGSGARSSAMTLAAMPFMLLGITYYIDPQKTQVLWTTLSGQLVTTGCVLWVMLGFFVMKKMQDVKV